MRFEDISTLDWQKGNGLVPAVVQHADSGAVLMLGYMNREALQQTLETGRAYFYSRTRRTQWMKGETSGNVLNVVNISADCDQDALLILAEPAGPVCHRGTATCFADQPPTAAEGLSFLARLESVIARRIAEMPQGSYTARLFAEGPSRIAQKIGEEGVEVALAAIGTDDEKIVSETADLMYHLLLLMKSRNLSLTRVVRELESRHTSRS
jgi:phosphoribosyl-AMP cyclohydrolase / phosphoribosyl-ATP pyrophosphohydrolase